MQIEKQMYQFTYKKQPSLKTIYTQDIQQKPSLSLHSHGQKRNKKIFPHLAEQFQYKITNQQLLKNIMNPRRDKTILQNFHNKQSNKSRSTPQSNKNNKIINQDKLIRSQKINSSAQSTSQNNENSKIKGERMFQTQNLLEKNKKQNQKKFIISLQNYRMGKRIMNTKSSVQQMLKKSFYTYKNHKKNVRLDLDNLQFQTKNAFIRRKFINQNQLIEQKQNLPQNISSECLFLKKKSFFKQKKFNLQNDKIKFQPQNKYNKMKTFHFNRSNSLSSRFQNFQFSNHHTLKINSQFCNQNSQNLTKQNIQQRKNQINSYAFPYYNQIQLNQQTFIQQSRLAERKLIQSLKLFGKGQTILMIQQLIIDCNPLPKLDTVLILELVLSSKKTHSINCRQKTIITSPVQYATFQSNKFEINNNVVAFALNQWQLPNIISLRIYRVNGLSNHQLGTVDIDLSHFKHRENQKGKQIQFQKQIKINSQGKQLERYIYSGKQQSYLRKKRFNNFIDTQVMLKYKIYSKKFQFVQDFT